jgi:hypothetical protein
VKNTLLFFFAGREQKAVDENQEQRPYFTKISIPLNGGGKCMLFTLSSPPPVGGDGGEGEMVFLRVHQE